MAVQHRHFYNKITCFSQNYFQMCCRGSNKCGTFLCFHSSVEFITNQINKGGTKSGDCANHSMISKLFCYFSSSLSSGTGWNYVLGHYNAIYKAKKRPIPSHFLPCLVVAITRHGAILSFYWPCTKILHDESKIENVDPPITPCSSLSSVFSGFFVLSLPLFFQLVPSNPQLHVFSSPSKLRLAYRYHSKAVFKAVLTIMQVSTLRNLPSGSVVTLGLPASFLWESSLKFWAPLNGKRNCSHWQLDFLSNFFVRKTWTFRCYDGLSLFHWEMPFSCYFKTTYYFQQCSAGSQNIVSPLVSSQIWSFPAKQSWARYQLCWGRWRCIRMKQGRSPCGPYFSFPNSIFFICSTMIWIKKYAFLSFIFFIYEKNATRTC